MDCACGEPALYYEKGTYSCHNCLPGVRRPLDSYPLVVDKSYATSRIPDSLKSEGFHVVRVDGLTGKRPYELNEQLTGGPLVLLLSEIDNDYKYPNRDELIKKLHAKYEKVIMLHSGDGLPRHRGFELSRYDDYDILVWDRRQRAKLREVLEDEGYEPRVLTQGTDFGCPVVIDRELAATEVFREMRRRNYNVTLVRGPTWADGALNPNLEGGRMVMVVSNAFALMNPEAQIYFEKRQKALREKYDLIVYVNTTFKTDRYFRYFGDSKSKERGLTFTVNRDGTFDDEENSKIINANIFNWSTYDRLSQLLAEGGY